ncbi:MAG: potassium-transporting ATPase subunit KdpA, partial [Candidatus Obscuribacterales bacterium]|nr:potassium-transporting ATPase subunit KdpA [Candidatus Obscuribacterales bacterium]
MTLAGWVQAAIYCVLLLAITKPLGDYMYQVLEEDAGPLKRIFSPVEGFVYRFSGVDPAQEMAWTEYSFALLSFSLIGTLLTYVLIRLQGILPFNPMGFSSAAAPKYALSLTPDLAFNTAVSFATNTNWQNYAGESTLSYFSQMCALAYQNWISAAVGLAAGLVLIRGFARNSSSTVGNFWQDLVRAILYILLPICFVFSLVLVSEGVIQNFSPYTVAKTVEGAAQIIPQGPVASQEIIKMLGVNGGGIFNANSAHPFENPTPLSNFIEMLAIFAIPSALTYMFGKAVKDTRQGWALLLVMYALFLLSFFFCYKFEADGNPNLARQNVETSCSVLSELGGNMEGKETRFGLANSCLFAAITTDASCGAVNSMHDSYTPLGGMITLLNIQLGEVVFGGIGSGLYGILIFAVLTVFIAGLMVGRTPEYLGKKIEQKDVK